VSAGTRRWAGVGELVRLQEAGEASALEITQEALRRCDELDSELGCFLLRLDEDAEACATEIDRRRAAGEPLGPLAGVPIGVKDNLATRGVPTTAGSLILEGFVPPYDATCVQRLREADAVVLGKLNMDEFAMGSSNELSGFGPVHNPWDHGRVPGGSSGGSAAAVAAGLVAAALGSDTGGSVRQPAAFCGAVGLRPTYGRVSRYGLVAFASSLDQVGPLTRSVADSARVLQVIAGADPHDSTCSEAALPDLLGACEAPVDGLTIGVPREYFPRGADGTVLSCVEDAIEELVGLGCRARSVTLPHTPHAVGAYYLLAPAEASSNLARYDGVRYGRRAAAAPDLGSMYTATRTDGFGPEVTRRILLGTYVLSAGYYDQLYRRALDVRTQVSADFAGAFGAVDLIACPTTPTTAFRLGEMADSPLRMYLQDVFTIPASLAGLPALSLPCGLDPRGLPVSLQLIAPPFREDLLLKVGAAYERAGGHAHLHPEGC